MWEKTAELSVSTEIFCWMSTCNCSEEGTERERENEPKVYFPWFLATGKQYWFTCVFFPYLHAVGQPVIQLCHIISALLRYTACGPSTEIYSVSVEYF